MSVVCLFGKQMSESAAEDLIADAHPIIRELESQLAAERERAEKAEEDVKKFMALSKANEQLAEIAQHRADRAEQRIKASEDQEPAFVIHDELGNTHNLYKQPPIPPELSEVVRERDELRRKLAEQQSQNNFDAARLRRLVSFCGVAAPDSDEALLQVAGVVIGSCLRNLTKLIEEAKRQAVPEGWKLVPIEPTEEMIMSAIRASDCPMTDSWPHYYSAMLSAAPQPHKD